MRGRRVRSSGHRTAQIAGGLFLLALLARVTAFRSAYDVFIDETIYMGIADNLARGRGLTFEGNGIGFYLHPPLLFLFNAGWLGLVHAVGADPVTQVFAGRVLGCLFGATNCALLYALVRRAGAPRAAVVVALAYSVEPFIIRFDARVFLEAPTMTWLLTGMLVLLPLADRTARRGRGPRSAGAGALFGLALLTKEPSALMFGLPLAYCLVRGGPLGRRDSATALVVAALTYLPYPVIATVIDGPQYLEQKTVGVRRLLGLEQQTGFNQPGAPSFVGRLVAQLPYFSTTYLVIAVGLMASLVVLRTRPAPQQVLALWGLAAFGLLLYGIAIGTLEEQAFYFLVVPALVNVGLVLSVLPTWQGWRQPAVRATAVLTAVAYGLTCLAVWTRVRTSDDTGVVRTVAWLDANVPRGSRILVLADGVQLVLRGYDVVTDPGSSGARYAITSSLQIEQGYGFVRPAQAAALAQRSTVVHTVTGRSMGDLVVLRMNS